MVEEKTRQRVVSGVGWSSLSSAINYALLFMRTFILVRFLAPEDFGVMALSLLLVSVMKQLSHIGLEAAVIQDANVSESTFNTVWVVAIIRGGIFFVFIHLFSPYYASFFQEAKLVPILAILSIAPLLNGFKNSYIVSAEKDLRFDVLFRINVTTSLIEFLATIFLAIIYLDVIALAIGYALSSAVGFVLSFVLISPRPKFVFNQSEFLRLFKFGKWVFGGGVIVFLILNIDTSVVGKILGATLLGYYQIAFRLGNFAATDIVLTFSKAIYPSFSLVKEDKRRLKDFLLTTILIISLAVVPIMMIIGFYAQSFVAHFLGDDWAPVVVPLQVLIIFGVIRSLASVCGYVFWAVGKPNLPAKISFLQLIFIVTIILPLTTQYGIVGTAMAVTIPLALSSLVSFYLVGRELEVNKGDLKEFFLTPVLSLAFLSLAILWCLEAFDLQHSWFGFVFVTGGLLATFYGLVYIFDRISNKKIRGIVMSVQDFLPSMSKPS